MIKIFSHDHNVFTPHITRYVLQGLRHDRNRSTIYHKKCLDISAGDETCSYTERGFSLREKSNRIVIGIVMLRRSDLIIPSMHKPERQFNEDVLITER